jgi:hypothetical protein
MSEEYDDDEKVAMTTVMLCNIPCRAKLAEITKAVDSLGFEGSYDLLHAPGPKRRFARGSNMSNIGYAFINFLRPEHAERFIQGFDGFHFEGRHSVKVGKAKFARVQGFHNNYSISILKGGASHYALPCGIPSQYAHAIM